MRKISQIIFMLIISIAIACIANITEAGTEVIIDNNYQLISSKRVGRTYYEYTYQITMINNGPDVKNVIATVTSTSPNTTIIDGNVNVGSIASGDTIISTDTFTIRQNRRFPFDPASLIWNVQYEIAAQIILPEGGEIQGEDGIVFIVPEGATTEPISVTITALQENNLGTAPPPNTTFLGGAVIDMGQNELIDNADISLPAPDGVPDGAEVYLAKLVEYAGQTMYQMIDTAVVQNGIIVSQDPAFPGITGSGTYCFLWAQDVGWIEGQVTNINSGMAVPGAVVTLSGGYWLNIADENGYYSLPAWAGNFVVNAFDDQTGDHGEKQGFMPNNGATVTINIQIGESQGSVQDTLTNGDFENGLDGWILTGAGGAVDSFGPISPYSGNYMAMISSGNGAVGDASSALEQSFTVPAGATTLIIHYNFVSEEYPEYVGSQYNDVFYATLHTPNGSREIAFEEVNSANFEPISGIPCGSGDCTWGQTGWLEASVDVSEWAGTDDTLTLTVHDVGDTIFDTVVLLDDIDFRDINQNYFQMLLSKARKGDILLFSACDGSVTEPLNCTEGVIEYATNGFISGIGYGYFQHAALIYEINANSFSIIQARSPISGVGVDPFTITGTYNYTSICLLRVSGISDVEASAVADYAFYRWNNTEYDYPPLPYNDSVYCSELVWDSYYNYARIDLGDKSYYPAGVITPDNLLQSEHTEILMCYQPIK